MSNNIMCFSQVGFQIDDSKFELQTASLIGLDRHHWPISFNLKTFLSQGDYLELAARVKELEHKMEPRWDFIKTFIIGLS